MSVAELEPHEFTDKSGTTISFWIEDVKIGKPFRPDSDAANDPRVLPRECRERRQTPSLSPSAASQAEADP